MLALAGGRTDEGGRERHARAAQQKKPKFIRQREGGVTPDDTRDTIQNRKEGGREAGKNRRTTIPRGEGMAGPPIDHDNTTQTGKSS